VLQPRRQQSSSSAMFVCVGGGGDVEVGVSGFMFRNIKST
jgi:hypothetical protein